MPVVRGVGATGVGPPLPQFPVAQPPVAPGTPDIPQFPVAHPPPQFPLWQSPPITLPPHSPQSPEQNPACVMPHSVPQPSPIRVSPQHGEIEPCVPPAY